MRAPFGQAKIQGELNYSYIPPSYIAIFTNLADPSPLCLALVIFEWPHIGEDGFE